MFKTALTAQGAAARATILDGFRRGRRAKWLPAVRWEDMLELPIGEVRARLGAGDPVVYTEIRSSQLKAAAASAA